VTYDWQCNDCNEVTVIERKISQSHVPPDACSKCGAKVLTKIITTTGGFTLKGDGWHKVEYDRYKRRDSY
jgi:putative FmdB family regulatory protein